MLGLHQKILFFPTLKPHIFIIFNVLVERVEAVEKDGQLSERLELFSVWNETIDARNMAGVRTVNELVRKKESFMAWVTVKKKEKVCTLLPVDQTL